MNKDEIFTLDILKISKLLKNKKITSFDLVKLLLERINMVDPHLNSFISINDIQALNGAMKADKEISAGNYKGVLHGVPIGLKDMVFTENIKTTMGSEIYKDFIPKYDANIVKILKKSGAIILGKLNTHEFAYGPTGDRSFFGPVKNPYNLNKMSGGSSSGSAVAVSAFMSYGSIGTDTGGSIRIPASFCGVVGMKPTYNLVDKKGVFPLAESLDHIGPMTRNVKDNILMLEAMTQKKYWNHDENKAIISNVKDIKIGIPERYYYENIEDEIANCLDKTIGLLTSLGFHIQKVDLPNLDKYKIHHRNILRSESFSLHEENLKKFPNKWDSEVKERLFGALQTKGYEYYNAIQEKNNSLQDFNKVFKKVDVLLAPTVPILPLDINERVTDLVGGSENFHIRDIITKLTSPTNYNGLPSLSIPIGFSRNKLPIGAQLIGREYEEHVLYAIAEFIEKELQLNLNVVDV